MQLSTRVAKKGWIFGGIIIIAAIIVAFAFPRAGSDSSVSSTSTSPASTTGAGGSSQGTESGPGSLQDADPGAAVVGMRHLICAVTIGRCGGAVGLTGSDYRLQTASGLQRVLDPRAHGSIRTAATDLSGILGATSFDAPVDDDVEAIFRARATDDVAV